MAAQVEFVPAKASDAAAISALRRRIWDTTYRGIYPDAAIDDFDYAWHRQRDLQRIADPSFTVCLIRSGAEKIGYLIFQEADSGLVLHSLYVLREYQHRGIGKKAFALLRDRCREKGLRGFSCQCNPHNENAMEFYRRMGGTVTKTDIGHENRQEDTVVFRFDLPADDRKGSDTGGGSITSGGGGLRAAVFP